MPLPAPPHPVRRALFCAALLLGGCSSSEEALYTLQIVGPPDAFVGATSVALYKRDQEIARTTVSGQGTFTLEVGGIDPTENDSIAVFAVRGLDAQNKLVAYGETPLIEVQPAAQELKIFVQKPGTVVRSTDFPVKLRNQTIFKAETQPTVSVNLIMTAPVFAHGETVDKQFSTGLYVYNPLTHAVEKILDLPQPRSEAVGVSRADGALFLFGGFVLPKAAPAVPEPPALKASQQLDLVVVGREAFKKFVVPTEIPPVTTADPITARAGAVVAAIGTRRLLIGGYDDYMTRTPLATVAALDEPSPSVFAVRPHKSMTAPRLGHTATTDPTQSTSAPAGTVLVYGGALAPEASVAELLDPRTETFTPLTWGPTPVPASHPAGHRKFHQAVVLPTKTSTGAQQVLLLGGLDDAGAPRADSVLCVPSAGTCEPGPVTLRTARAHFAAFVLNNDLVVVGGIGPDGNPVANTEIFDIRLPMGGTSFTFVGAVPSLGRSHLTATTLPNLSAVISGGQIGADVATTIEIYQPNRPTQ